MELTQTRKSLVLSTGLAMFAMFFGAGNIVFPLALGQLTQDKNFFGVMGMVITAVFVPLIGLLGMLLYEGDYRSFFSRIGRIPGFLMVVCILGVIGPFGGIPRCITISHSTLGACGMHAAPWFSLPFFAIVSCALIFLFTYRPRKIISLLGYVLTPVLLLSLLLVAVRGYIGIPEAAHCPDSASQVFFRGLIDGYSTMDLLAAFFFSSVVLLSLKRGGGEGLEEKGRIRIALAGSLIAATLLALVYIAFTFLAAGYSESLSGIPNHQLLGTLAYRILGPYAGLVAGIAVSFACLTTEIALTAIFAEFLRKTLFREKLSYPVALGITLLLTFLISSLHFEGISSFLVPILQVGYPALIVLTLLNILHKLYDFKPVKLIFYGAFLTSFILYVT